MQMIASPKPIASHWSLRRKQESEQVRLENFYKNVELASRQISAAKEVEWIVEGIIPSGALLILAGPGKRAGKSQLAIGLCKAVAAETPFLGRKVNGGAAFYCNLEDGKPRTARRLKQHGITDQDINLPFWVLHEMDQLHAALAVMNNGSPKLVIIDPLSELELDSGINDENDSGQITGLFKPLRALVQETNSTLIIVHHFSKSKAMMRGSSALEAASDGWLEYSPLIKASKHDTRRRLSWVLRDAGADETLVDVDIPKTYALPITFYELSNADRQAAREEEAERLATRRRKQPAGAAGALLDMPSFLMQANVADLDPPAPPAQSSPSSKPKNEKKVANITDPTLGDEIRHIVRKAKKALTTETIAERCNAPVSEVKTVLVNLARVRLIEKTAAGRYRWTGPKENGASKQY